jgi:glycerate 2-kinase
MKSKSAPVYIKNWETLTHHGNIGLREDAVDILDHGLIAADPYRATQELVSLKGDQLRVGNLSLDLRQYERVFVFGAGKATLPIAQALEDILGSRITGGLVVLKKGNSADLKQLQVIYGAHPVPDEEGHRGAQLMYQMAGECTQKDLVLAVITGGSSALLPLPAEGISLDDKKKVNQLLLFSGADIKQINTVRKHLSGIKGGWLAKQILPATLVNLTVSDVIGDPLDYITGPSVADTSTFDDARQVMDEYELWDQFPPSAAKYLREDGQNQETPKDFTGQPLHSFIVVESAAACLGAAKRAKALGYQSMILSTFLKGEAKDAGVFFASIANEISLFDRPMARPCVILAGGENTVTIHGDYGIGGPNQEFALGAGLEISGLENVVIASIDTDGADGPTHMTGGMVDGSTLKTSKSLGMDLPKAIHKHNATPILEQLCDAIFTGQTGTNINDLKLLLVSSTDSK